MQSAEFWCAFGRAVASIGFLEQTLVRVLASWPDPGLVGKDLSTNEVVNKLSDQLGVLVKRLQDHCSRDQPRMGWEGLIERLEKINEHRRTLTHAEWCPTGDPNAAEPRMIKRNGTVPVGNYACADLDAIANAAAEAACDVMNLLTTNGIEVIGWPRNGAGPHAGP